MTESAAVVAVEEIAPPMLGTVKGELSFLVPEPKIEPLPVVGVPNSEDEIGVVLLSLGGVPNIDPLLIGCPLLTNGEAPPNEVVGFVTICSVFEGLLSVLVTGVEACFESSCAGF